MVNSQNGWPAKENTNSFTRFTAGGVGFWAANPDVATVFTEFIEQFVKRIEPILGSPLDDWSYANRLVRGSTKVVSNHGSATAIDLNALQHPRGVHNTFTAAERRIMHEIKNSITDDRNEPVLRLGLDYDNTVDDMHVEVNVNATRVAQAARKIREKNKAKEDDVTEKELHAAIVKVLTDEKIVDNTPTAEQAARGIKPSKMTVASVLSNLEKQGDGDTDSFAAYKTEVNGRLEKIEQTLAAVLKAVSPPSGK